MAKRRTRAEKELARLRRLVEKKEINPVNSTEKRENANLKRVTATADFYVPELALPVKLLRLDLTKSVGVTILALILQIALAVYLNRGGWQFVNSVLFNRMSKF